MTKRHLITIALVVYSFAIFAQSSNSHLLFQYFGANENQSEIVYISQYLEKNNLTMPGPDQEKAIIEAHDYYLAHKEDIDMAIKANELILFRTAVKERKAAMWSQALTSFASSLASSLPAAIEAGQKQQEDYQKKLNRDKEIQAYIAQNSSSTPIQYTQNFGNTPVGTNTITQPRVTTSNGYDTPLPSASYNKTSSIDFGGTSGNSNEQIIQAVYVSGNQLVTCRLRYNSGRIWAYSTSKNMLNNEEWVSIQTPETPMTTMPLRDGDYAKDYRYTVSGAGKKFYFNM